LSAELACIIIELDLFLLFLKIIGKTASQNTKKRIPKMWTEYRDRLESRILGLGLAKTSFALEMQHPLEAHCFCADTHLFQLYKLNQSKHGRQYNEYRRALAYLEQNV